MVHTSIEVISMQTAHARRAAFAAQPRPAGAMWRFADALTVPPPPLAYDEKLALRRFGRALSRGEVGCFASHYRAWCSLLESRDDQRLVLEDDVVLDWDAVERLLRVDLHALGIDLLRLYSTHPFRWSAAAMRFLGPHHHLVRVHGLFLGTQGYVVTRHGAERLVRAAKTVDRPVDWLMARYWRYGFPNYCMFPFPLMERYVASEIGERALPGLPGTAPRLARFGVRTLERLRRGLADHVWLRPTPFGTADAGPAFVDKPA